jgi:translocator protein
MGLFPVFLLTCVAAGAAGVFFRPGVWYRKLAKPDWTPPNWMFPVIWAVLYVLIALAAARISEVPDNDLALGLWGLQITINTLWSGVFFGLHRMLAGAVIIASLWVAVLATTVVFWGHDMTAALMMVPYLIWGTYALALNTSVWLRNRNRAVPVK